MKVPRLDVRKGHFSLEQPWEKPEQAAAFALLDSTDGSPPRLATAGFLFYDRTNLYVAFEGSDDPEPVATYTSHDDPLYEEDVYEVFLAPDALTDYFEIEVNPLGTTFDARIHSPDGERRTMRADRSWECHGLWSALRRTHEEQTTRADALIVIPFSSIRDMRPQPDEIWRANFFRIDRSASRGDSYSAWSPTFRSPADFHVPAAFGEIRFR